MNKYRRASLMAGTMLLAMLDAGIAHAQQGQQKSPVTAAETDSDAAIVVTARRREEKLSDIPSAATVLDGNSIAERGGAVTPVELLGGQPSVRILDTGSPMTNEISLRGSPTSRGTAGDPSVGLF